MKIAQSNVNLVSSHHYYEENQVSIRSGVVTRQSFLESLKGQEKKMDELTLSDESGDGTALSSESYSSLRPQKSEYLSPAAASLEEQIAQIRANLLERILRLLQSFGEGRESRSFSQTLSSAANELSAGSFLKVTTVTMTHTEEESTTFSGTGMALTEDGREIDFNVDFAMSRILTEQAGISYARSANFIDPLVINVGSDVTHISDQSFYFDLDCDGKDDKISEFKKGSGFLALDKNGDGRIGDGSELFGTKSGDGFKDLSFYDKDGNGWIDENDEVYDKLRVWLRNEDGTDTLMDLKEADVGAIYLGSAGTEFTHLGAGFMKAAQTRSTGVFLKESGGVGTLQQVDLAAM